jgi:hypothetical protein
VAENGVALQGMLNEATLNKVIAELRHCTSSSLSLKLVSVIAKQNRLERLLREEVFEEL